VFHTLLTKQEPEEYPSTVTYRQHPVTGKGMMQGADTNIDLSLTPKGGPVNG
jgi:hypothetical protein